MNQFVKAVCLLMLLVSSDSTFAEFSRYQTGTGLLEDCKAAIRVLDGTSSQTFDFDTSVRARECLSYVNGILDMETFYRHVLILDKIPIKKNSILGCIPGDVTLDQQIRVIVKFLEDHPEFLNLPSSALITEALSTAFPCPEEKINTQ